ncbi:MULTISPECIES: recombination mediator RecR [Ectothiorhodospira]|uniref:Recombination protein RecR n=1 Tax=Ectothiorhodospira marina TaxID=1396821 RepID=A0A1H7KJF0_9GAMM|nr:recombination mediator RecR [Ectothiorhodospira marina]MCG5515276.1 recombination mediator RecR [Ectothiorhodospira sp. 9100]MCG5517875.1 recombination mediator RecR [Ectothiorhodospira sp. 9905]SEK86991.1 DNA replication and repair protein RecR [Ectothiorhodospira marina]
MAETSLLERLVEGLRCLPGVGPKSAQRMALHVLERDREGALRLAAVLREAVERIGHCRVCRTLTEHEVCHLCADSRRDRQVMCVVEAPADVLAIEQATGFRGQYHVLLGQLSPLDGVGPEELGLDQLEARLSEGEVAELILATGSTVEGEVTAHYISEMARSRGIRTTRIAHGIPLGGELEYVDRGTLSHAFDGRRDY